MSENIDFQNGFLCGMATKGLVRSGELYKPICWNDEGVYDYFYIDFKQAVAAFSIGMLSESIVVHDSIQVPITNFEKVSDRIYKVYADLAGKTHGVTVLNKVSTYLTFANGSTIPAFSILFYVAGIDKYERMQYLFERFNSNFNCASNDAFATEPWTSFDAGSLYESVPASFISDITENVSIALI